MWLLRYLSFTDNRLRGGPRLLVDLGRSQRGFRYFSIDKYQSILLTFSAYRFNPLLPYRLDPHQWIS
jgi:hypothetical protein